MVRKLALFFAYTLFFVMLLIYFTPKSNFYFFIEHELQKHEVVLSGEKIKDKGLTLLVTNANLTYKAIESATIAEMCFKVFGLYNSLEFKNIAISPTLKSFLPLEIQSIRVVYSVLNPLNITAYAVGGFGEAEASYNIVKSSVHLDIKPSKLMLQEYTSTLKNLEKTENGEFTYDKTF